LPPSAGAAAPSSGNPHRAAHRMERAGVRDLSSSDGEGHPPAHHLPADVRRHEKCATFAGVPGVRTRLPTRPRAIRQRGLRPSGHERADDSGRPRTRRTGNGPSAAVRTTGSASPRAGRVERGEPPGRRRPRPTRPRGSARRWARAEVTGPGRVRVRGGQWALSRRTRCRPRRTGWKGRRLGLPIAALPPLSRSSRRLGSVIPRASAPRPRQRPPGASTPAQSRGWTSPGAPRFP
jgi:hypothetical protein